MDKLFVDTSGWACFFISNQVGHSLAVQIMTKAFRENQQVVTSNYVIAELVALLQSRGQLPRPQIFTLIDTVKATPYLNIIHIDLATDTAAWNLCKARPDKNWSLVDCTSFILMQQYKIQVALTTDRHFEQAGFIRLLNSSNS